LAFLTPLPVGRDTAPSAGTLAWFPVAGALVGLAVGAAWWAAGEAFPPLVAAAVAVAADAALTGALHLDGLADSADGLLPHLDSTERRRAVMAAPDVGAFGVAAVACALLLRVAALASLAPDAWLVAAHRAASRSCMAVALAGVCYVGGGLGAAFAGAPVWPGDAGALAAAAHGSGGVVAVAALVVAAGAVVALAHRRLGGVTGDILGAAGVVGETVALVVATA
jgi:adenosylcobinamide-GDP ribazoletransferase